MLSVLHTLPHFVLKTALWARYYYYPHFMVENIEARSSVTCPKVTQSVAEPGLNWVCLIQELLLAPSPTISFSGRFQTFLASSPRFQASRLAWKTHQQENTQATEMGGLCEGSKISKPLMLGWSHAAQPWEDVSQQPFSLEGLWIWALPSDLSMMAPLKCFQQMLL